MNFHDAFPDNLILEDEHVCLRGLSTHDFEQLKDISNDNHIWTYFTKNLSNQNELRQWIEEALADVQNQRRFPFAIIKKSTQKICGSTSFGNISFYDRRIEIGWSWLGKAFMGTGINTHAKFLLLQYAFDKLGFIRVEIKTDNLNERAKRALEKIGAKPEGVLRSHMQMPDNRRRDSIYYSILNHEWTTLREKFL